MTRDVAAATPGLSSSTEPLVAVHDLALLDLDGVVYVGDDAVPGAADAIAATAAAGVRVAYVTNNASRTPQDVAAHLARLGIPAAEDDVVTSAQVAAAMLARRLPAGSAVLVVGGAGLRAALEAEGLRPVSLLEEAPSAVVQGFGPDVGWRELAEGARAVRSGLPWIATNLDLTVPLPDGPAPGNGALVQALATAAGRRPDDVAGKPGPAAFREAALRYGSARPIVVGDRLDTDIEGARAAGMTGLAVLTGIVGVSDLLAARPHERPDLVGADLGSLLESHPPVILEPGGAARCRQACVAVAGGRAEVRSAGTDPVDVLRAAAVAVWAWSDARTGPAAGAAEAAEATGAADAVGAAGRVAAAQGVPSTAGTVDPGDVVAAVAALDPAAAWAR